MKIEVIDTFAFVKSRADSMLLLKFRFDNFYHFSFNIILLLLYMYNISDIIVFIGYQFLFFKASKGKVTFIICL